MQVMQQNDYRIYLYIDIGQGKKCYTFHSVNTFNNCITVRITFNVMINIKIDT